LESLSREGYQVKGQEGIELLRSTAGGICGGDLHYYQYGQVADFAIREPLIPGHEASGTVAAIGQGVTRVKR